MATLPTLVPNVFNSQSGTTWTTTTVDNIDNTVATPSGTFVVAGANSTSSIFFDITNTPSDFVKILTLNYNIRYKIESLAGDTEVLFVRVWNAAKTTAYTNEATVATLTANQALTNKGSTALTITSAGLAASKADWDGALIEIRTTHAANMANDGSIWSIDEVELTGTYNSPPTTALNTPANAGTVSTTTPTLNFTGTDAESDTVGYNVQVDTVNTFDSSTLFGLLDSYTEDNFSFSLDRYDGSNHYTGQSFNGSNNKLSSVKLLLRKFGSPTGTLTAYLYAHTGTFGTSSVSTGSPLATSETFDCSTLTTTNALYELTFTGANQYRMVANTKYVIGFFFTSTFSDIDNYIRIGANSNSPTHAGNHCFGVGAPTSADNSIDLIFYLYDLTTPIINAFSASDAGFTAGHPFTSGQAKDYTVQSALTNGVTYHWRVRAIDPSGSNQYGAWAGTRSFTVSTTSQHPFPAAMQFQPFLAQ